MLGRTSGPPPSCENWRKRGTSSSSGPCAPARTWRWPCRGSKKNRIPLYGINENPDQRGWTTSPKAYAHILIDDVALGVPLVHPPHGGVYVDWQKVRAELEQRGVL